MTDDLEVVQKGTLNKMLAMQTRIEKLEAANLKQSCIKVDDQMRIETLEAVIKDDALWLAAYHLWCAMKGCAPSSSDLIAARKTLEGKDD